MKNVIIADVDPLAARKMKTVLSRGQYRLVGIAQSYQDLLNLMDHEVVEILILATNIFNQRNWALVAKDLRQRFNLLLVVASENSDEPFWDVWVQLRPDGYFQKPYRSKLVLETLDLVVAKQRPMLSDPNMPTYFSDSFFVKMGNALGRIRFAEVLYFEADSGYTIIHTSEKRVVDRRLLVEFESLVSGRPFLRIHRRYVVGVQFIQAIRGNLVVVKGVELPIGRTYKQSIMDLILRP